MTKGMKITRRTHLYAGLFLAPWVALYGVSGFIFNHHAWFAEPPAKPIEWTVECLALPQWPEPETLARTVVEALNAAEKDKTGAVPYQLSGAPRLEGGVSLQGQDAAGDSVSLFFDWEEGKGTTVHSPPGPREEPVSLAINDAALLDATKAALLTAAGKADPKLAGTRWEGDGDFPRLSLTVVQGKERRVILYDLRNGQASLRPAPEPRSMRVPDFLTSLHMSHGYPAAKKSQAMRIVQAVFVDAMAVLMCFWAVSGIAMWLQLKHLRRSGLMVAIASLVAAWILWSAMHRFFMGN